jgi:RimJ/RimL family protein N-acetyltransferase
MRPQLAELEQLPTLQAQRTTLRPLRIEDAGDLYQVYSDPETMRYWSSPPHPDEPRTREMIVSAEESFEDRSALQWAIERRSDRRVLGTVTLLPDPRQPRAELGFIIGREHWGRGYAGEAQRRVARFGFEELRLHRLEADTHPDNEASARSLERLGFRREGVLRERWLVGGERSDSVIWGLLASEWNAEDGVP